MAYLSSITRLAANDVATLTHQLPDPQIGQHRPKTATADVVNSATAGRIIRATFDARQWARRTTWETPRFLCGYDGDA